MSDRKRHDFTIVPTDAPPYAEEIDHRPMLGICPDCGHNWKTTLGKLRRTAACPRCRSPFKVVNVLAAKAEELEGDIRAQERVDKSPTLFLPGSATGKRLAGFWGDMKKRLS